MVMVWLVSDYRFPIQKAIKKTILLKIAVAWFLSFLFFSFVCLRILCRCFIFFFHFDKTKFSWFKFNREIFFLICKQFLFIYSCLQKCFECQPPIVCHWHWLHRIFFSFRFVSFAGSVQVCRIENCESVSQCEREREREN